MESSNYLDRMQEIMKENGSNAAQTTEKLGIAKSAFSDWKKGKGRPVFESIVKFAELYGTSLDYIAWGNAAKESDISISQSSSPSPSDSPSDDPIDTPYIISDWDDFDLIAAAGNTSSPDPMELATEPEISDIIALVKKLPLEKRYELKGYIKRMVEEEANALPRPKGSHGVPIAPEPPAAAHKVG